MCGLMEIFERNFVFIFVFLVKLSFFGGDIGCLVFDGRRDGKGNNV